MTELQKRIIELLTKDLDHFTCDEIAWELKVHKMHVGNSIKYLVKKGIVEGYVPWSGGNQKYFYCL